MILYELHLEGYQTPLTREQIAELYHAGRISKDDPCKPTAKKEWQTVDEHFPLLKHSGPTLQVIDAAPQRWNRMLIGLILAFALATTIAGYLLSSADTRREIATADSEASYNSATAGFAKPSFQYSISPTRIVPQTQSQPSAVNSPLSHVNTYPQALPASRPVDYARIERERVRLEQERLARDQSQRQQAASADQLRAQQQQQEDARKRAAGTDTIVPLDTYYPVTVGASIVTVKVHDNNTSSFDIWINGQHYRDLPKNKGITGSRTDETLVYRSGSAELYYVWEISGELNHCRLRVRES